MTSCPKCEHTHVAGDAVALSRFTALTGYRTADGEIHATREDAQEWLCKQRQKPTIPPTPSTPGEAL